MSQATRTVYSCDICGSEHEEENLIPLFGKSGVRVDICYQCKSKPISTVIMVIVSTDGLVAAPQPAALEAPPVATVAYTSTTDQVVYETTDRDEAWQQQLDEIEKLAAQIPTLIDRSRYLVEQGWRRSGNYWAPPGEEDGPITDNGLPSHSGVYTVPTAIREQLARERKDCWPDRRGRYWHGRAQNGKSNW